MDRQVQKIDESRDRQVWVMQSATEAQNFRRAFPDPLPKGHVLQWYWRDNGKCGELVFEVVDTTPPAKAAAPASLPRPVLPPKPNTAVVSPAAAAGGAQQQQQQSGGAALDPDRLEELRKLSVEQLETLGAELELDLDHRKQTKAAMVGLIAQHEADRLAAAAK